MSFIIPSVKNALSVCYVLSHFCFWHTNLAQAQNLCLVFQVMVIYYGNDKCVMRSYISRLGMNKAIYVKINIIL
jgi:hypothetical protein